MASEYENTLVIGFSGVTSGGKSSVCDKISEALSSMVTIINMDDYFWPEDSPHHIYEPECCGHANWEAIESVNFESMYQDVMKWKEKASKDKTSILLVDGILIFNYKPLLPLFQKKYFFTLTKEQCWERRKLRVYEPPDPVGYYDKVVWPMYLQNKKELEDTKDIVYIDSSGNQNEIFNLVLKDVQDMLKKDEN